MIIGCLWGVHEMFSDVFGMFWDVDGMFTLATLALTFVGNTCVRFFCSNNRENAHAHDLGCL